MITVYKCCKVDDQKAWEEGKYTSWMTHRLHRHNLHRIYEIGKTTHAIKNSAGLAVFRNLVDARAFIIEHDNPFSAVDSFILKCKAPRVRFLKGHSPNRAFLRWSEVTSDSIVKFWKNSYAPCQEAPFGTSFTPWVIPIELVYPDREEK